jgi:hypothetical protein
MRALTACTLRVRRPTALATLVAAARLGVATGAAAQASDPAAAETLFDEGRRLMLAGDYAQACPKFEASQRLDPGVGTLLNLGDCLERSGRTASAWTRFREAAAAAVEANQRERESVARHRVEVLDPRLCRVRVNVNAAQTPDEIVQRDGVVLDHAVWGEAVPVDPGNHEIVATSLTKRTWSTVAKVDGATCAGTVVTIEVPALEVDPAAVLPLMPSSSQPEAPPQRTRWGLQRELALGAGGAAVVACGVAIYLALDARSVYNTARSTCTANGCSDVGSSAGPLADDATAMFVTAGVLAATGAILWFTAPSHAVTVGPQLAPASHGSGLAVVGLRAAGSWQ